MDTNSYPTLSCLVIDDEQTAHLTLARLIESVSWLALKGHCYSAVEAADAITSKRPDLIFLDIEMPRHTGLDLIGMLNEPKPQIILTTAFRDYAFDGFENEVSSFLLKPIMYQRFYKAVNKVRECLRARELQSVLSGKQPQASTATAGDTPESQIHDDTIWIYSGKKFHHLRLNEVYAVEGLKDYVKVHCADETILVKGNIGSIERKLPASEFVRIHRSYIVNRSAIRRIEGNMVKMPNGSNYTIPTYKSRENIINLLLDRQRRI